MNRGTERSYLMRRLAQERPDLAARVATGSMSAFKAAVQAGLTQPRFSLGGHDPDVLAKTIRRNLPPDVLDAVLDRLVPARHPGEDEPCPDHGDTTADREERSGDPMAGNWCGFCLIPSAAGSAPTHRLGCPTLDEDHGVVI